MSAKVLREERSPAVPVNGRGLWAVAREGVNCATHGLLQLRRDLAESGLKDLML